ncbi:hypothetical protein, partial [Pseudomonas aeruginosa]|uniref:hypothetical protein n=1 Tax=Pseudomonas aeruginosa TaxID=287 RepID=UPI001E5E830D
RWPAHCGAYGSTFRTEPSTFEGIRRKAMFNAYPCRRSSPANALPTNPEAPVNKTLFIFHPFSSVRQ